ncbi:MAG: dihydrodipicolinate synthase family protein [Bryobacterales bacterium]|jgi:N-acetylneuraminate lyase|nr:dihydrodipicolinate synthase family protein [Bryobacterales bacterium]
MSTLQGILPALVTPLNADGALATATAERLLDFVYRSGADGVYVCGQTGEGPLLPPEVRRAMTEVCVRCSPPGKNVVVHVGAPRLDEAIELARHAERAGAHALSSLPQGPYTLPEIRGAYERLASATGLPFLVYFFPSVCPALSSAEALLDLVRIENVVGLKFTDFDLFKLWTLRSEGAVVFNGHDEVLASGLLAGANGGIGTFYNLVPDLFVEIYAHARAGRWEQARKPQSEVNELIRTTLRFPVLPAVKKALEWCGFDCGPCMAPRLPLTPDQERALRAALESTCLADRMAGAAAR